MAGCDASIRNYSYDDVDGDMNLTHFALAMEDFNYKVLYIIEFLGGTHFTFESPYVTKRRLPSGSFRVATSEWQLAAASKR